MCIDLGYWLLHFKTSTSIIILRPNKTSYDTPKMFRPIVLLCQIQFTLGWKSAEDDREKSEIEVSTNWCVAVEHWRSSLIRVIFINYQTSELQYNY